MTQNVPQDDERFDGEENAMTNDEQSHNDQWGWWHVAGAILGFFWFMAYPLFTLTALVVGKALKQDLDDWTKPKP